LCHVKLVYVSLGQISSGKDKLCQGRSRYFRLLLVRPRNVRLCQVSSG